MTNTKPLCETRNYEWKRRKEMKTYKQRITIMFLALTIFWLGVNSAQAQTTEFTYQGSLKNGASPASGNHDFEFLLYDAILGGTQLGSTISVNNVPVTDGVFSVKLNFGNQFSGANRFLEIRVRQSGQGGITILAPRQLINSTPYSVKSLNADNATTAVNATQLGGISANQFVLTGDARLSDDRNPLPNSANYIQNTTSQQTSSNFNISGTGNADIFNAATAYYVDGRRALTASLGQASVFAGFWAGVVSTGGFGNSFFGSYAGYSNTNGNHNSFFGYNAGLFTIASIDNSFFGSNAGNRNTGSGNSFFGRSAGVLNGSGEYNSFFGEYSGNQNTTGKLNSFFGAEAGNQNTTGWYNTMIGYLANGGSGDLTNATAIGTRAFVTQSNSLVLGSINGVNGAISDTNVGIGTTTPSSPLQVQRDANLSNWQNAQIRISGNFNANMQLNLGYDTTNNRGLIQAGNANVAFTNLLLNPFGGKVGIGTTNPATSLQINTPGVGNILIGDMGCGPFPGIGFSATLNCTTYSLVGNGTDTIINRPTGGSIFFRENNGTQMSISPGGVVTINTLGAAGGTTLCRNVSNQISTCSSSIRYKTNINSFSLGLSLIKKLRPVAFNWRADNQTDFGLVAEEVADAEPLLVTRNEKGEVEGVKYDRLGVVLLNAVKEQQTQIEQQNVQIEQQRQQLKQQQQLIDALKILVCASNPQAEICKEKQDEK